MYLVTSKQNNNILGMGAELDYMSNGYPRLIDINTAYPTEMVNVYEVDSVPDGVEPAKYCYTPEKGFYENPDWEPPYDANAKVKELEQQVTDLQLALCDVYEMLPGEGV